MAAPRVMVLPTSDMAVSGTDRILTAIERLDLNQQKSIEAIAGLKADVLHMSVDLRDLGVKVDGMERDKVSRGELISSDSRHEKSLAEVKASAAFEAGRLSQNLTSAIDEVRFEVHGLREKLDDETAFRNRIIGARWLANLLAGIFGGAVMWALRFLIGK